MDILIIEDDDFKSRSLRDFIHDKISSAKTKDSTSLVEAITEINRKEYDLVLVDMAIPSHPTNRGEGAPMSLLTGGLDILLEIQALDRNDPCIIITQYHEIEISGELYPLDDASKAIKDMLECDVLGCIEYSEDHSEWKAKLESVLQENEYLDT